MDEHVEAFMVYVTFLLTIEIHPAKEAQISLLIAKEVQILSEYSDFLDVFFKKKALILPEAIELNQHIIKL